MKLTKEQIVELTGSTPPEIEGKKVVGLEYRPPVGGDMCALEETWRRLVQSNTK
jgi:hypothetical protein